LAYGLELGVDWVALLRAITVHAGMVAPPIAAPARKDRVGTRVKRAIHSLAPCFFIGLEKFATAPMRTSGTAQVG